MTRKKQLLFITLPLVVFLVTTISYAVLAGNEGNWLLNLFAFLLDYLEGPFGALLLLAYLFATPICALIPKRIFKFKWSSCLICFLMFCGVFILRNIFVTPCCSPISLIVDNGCNLKQSSPAGHVEDLSPISLTTEDDFDINEDAQIVSFNLDLSSVSENTKQITTWKASDKAPLLVFDPEHKGEIKDASMLFGNWTFGGKEDGSRWSDGYEALATLDVNNDGKISGSELAPLGLWFDKNRNGISEEGEVKQLSEVGITSLFYKGAHRYDKTPDLKLERGYERVLNEKTVYGSSIDWFGRVRNINKVMFK